MASTISSIHTGIASNLATITGLRTSSYQPEQLNPPCAFPVLNSVTYNNRAFGGANTCEFTVYVIVGRWVDRTAQALLDDYLSYSGNKSIRKALESDLTLGGTVQTLVVSSAASINSVTSADAEFLQIQLSVTVYG